MLSKRQYWLYCYVNIQAFNIVSPYDYSAARYVNIMSNIDNINNKIANDIKDDTTSFVNLLMNYLQYDCLRFGSYVIPKV